MQRGDREGPRDVLRAWKPPRPEWVAAESSAARPTGVRRGASPRCSSRRPWSVIALVAAYPIGYAIWLSLNEYSVRVPGLSRWAGFDNYTEALGSTRVLGGGQEHVHLHRRLGHARARDRPRDGARDARGVQGPRTAAHGRCWCRGRCSPWSAPITWRTLFEPNLGLAPVILEQVRHRRRHPLARPGGLRHGGDDPRRRLEDRAVHGAAAAGGSPGDPRRRLRRREGRRRHDLAALPAHHASPC